MLVLTDRAAVYRSVAEPAKGPRARSQQTIFDALACLVVPVSSYDRVAPYARESTHVVWVPRWATLIKEDELRVGYRQDVFADRLEFVYVVEGVRRFKFGFQHRAYYVSERS